MKKFKVILFIHNTERHYYVHASDEVDAVRRARREWSEEFPGGSDPRTSSVECR